MFSRFLSIRGSSLARSLAVKGSSSVGFALVISMIAPSFNTKESTRFFSHCSSESLIKSNIENLPVPIIYQYKICPFCNRVKAYLDYLRIPYSVVEVNPLTKSQISFSGDHKKVPIATFGKLEIKESSNILNYITENYLPLQKERFSISKDFISDDTEKWAEWSEKKLAVLLYPNITRSFSESWECFEYSGNVDSWSVLQRGLVRVTGPVGMLFANGKIKKKYGILDERKELKELLTEWTSALNGQKFLHGESVSLPDLMVFGVLRSIDTCLTFREIMEDNKALKQWYENVATLSTSQEVCLTDKK